MRRDDSFQDALEFCTVAKAMAAAGLDISIAEEGMEISPVAQRLLRMVRGRGASESFGQALARCLDQESSHLRSRRQKPEDFEPAAESTGWRVVAAAVMMTEQSGASLSLGLEEAGAWLRFQISWLHRVQVALSGPKASANLLAWLPFLGVGMAQLAGIGALHVLLGTPIGWVLMACGALLTWAGVRWRRSILARVPRGASLVFSQLLAAGLEGGASTSRVRSTAAQVIQRSGLPGPDADERARVDRACAMASRFGLPVRALLLSAVDTQRSRMQRDFSVGITRAETRLLLPLGCCHLPAFVVLTVVPMVIALFASSGLQKL